MRSMKRIYYCWFGGKPLPQATKNYIESWRSYLPTYEIFEINEKNFDINLYFYAKTAYEQQKFAFVSDVARIHFLQQYGGIYFDTDVEIVSDFQMIELMKHDVTLSMEYFSLEVTGVNTSTIISAPDQPLWDDLLTYYRQTIFKKTDEPKTINMYINELLEENTAFTYKDKSQLLQYKQKQINIIPSNILMRKGKHTVAIHHLEGSWTTDLSFARKTRRYIGVILKKIIGRRAFKRLWEK